MYRYVCILYTKVGIFKIYKKISSFLDAPSLLYGNGTERQDVLSDGTGTITIYGLIGDQCLDDQDCFMDFTSCIGGVCNCQDGFEFDRNNMSCGAIQKSFCDPNPCKGTYY